MPILFDDDEAAYLQWVAAHPQGFVVNLDRRRTMPQYPMLHLANDASISSAAIGNFTTGDYIKVCGEDRTKLAQYCEREFERKLVPCRHCFRETPTGD